MVSDNRNAAGRQRHEGAPVDIRGRQFVDMAGISWRAYERRRPDQPPALVFESRNAVRLVRDYPENWYTLPSAALEALSWCV